MADTRRLEVPGASLRYEIGGSGPVLLLIPAGAGDAGAFTALAPLLRDRYTVVAYDPRGTSRSPLHGPPVDISVRTQADDARRLLVALGGGPATVFGTSAGAITGLELAVRYPEQVPCLVAHEPPVTELLPDRDRHRARTAELQALHREHGAGAAMGRFLADTGLSGFEADVGAVVGGGTSRSPAAPDPAQQAAMARFLSNLDMFFGHVVGPLGQYHPDIQTLCRASTRTVIAAGTESVGQLPHRAAAALATALGTPLAELPGDHRGYLSHPEAFTRALRPLLNAAQPD